MFILSSVNISNKLKTLLAFGLYFKLPVYKIIYFSSFESLVECTKRLNCPNDKVKELTCKLHLVAYKYFYNIKPHKVFSSIFTRNDVTLLKQLASNKNAIVSRPDKGRGD